MTLTSGSAPGSDPEWFATLLLRFPTPGGETDLDVEPRGRQIPAAAIHPDSVLPGVSQKTEEKVVAFSETAAAALHFAQVCQEVPSGLPRFDTAYRVCAIPQRFRQLPIDPALAGPILE